MKWGYDQTRWVFFQVIEVNKNMVQIKPISKDHCTISPSPYYEARVAPVKDSFCNEKAYEDLLKINKKRVGPGGKVKISSGYFAYPWDGKPKTESGDY